jgi:hypothetical protein
MTFEIKRTKMKEKREIRNPKTYYYKWGRHHRSKYGGIDGNLEVYEVKNGEIIKIGETFVQTRSMKGFEGETMNVLFKEKKITPEEFELDNGYYRRNLHKFRIRELI